MTEGVLAVVAVVLAVVQPVPQLVRTIRRGTAAGVAPEVAWLGTLTNGVWLAYGFARGLPAVVVVSAVYLAGWLAVAAVVAAARRTGRPSVPVAAAAVLAGAGWWGGWEGAGTVLAVITAGQHLPQVVRAWREADIGGLAPGTYTVVAVDGLVWGAYGVVVADGPLVLYGVATVATAGAVLAAVVLRRDGRGSVARPGGTDDRATGRAPVSRSTGPRSAPEPAPG